MNHSSQFDREDRLFDLANRACGCCGLTQTEETELAEILSCSAQAREMWTAFWQMESSLEMSEEILAAMADRPENVVSMPGAGNGSPSTIEEVPESSQTKRFVIDYWKCAAAVALLFLGVAVWKLEGPGTVNTITEKKGETNQSLPQTPVVSSPKLDMEPNKSAGTAPEEQYEKLLATAPSLGNGSLSRPNVNMNVVSAAGLAIVPEGEPLSYNKHVRPILSDNCFACHGPDEKGRKAKLRLDTEEGAKENSIVPGDVNASELIARITSGDPDEVMPPSDSHKKLNKAQIELLRRWVAEGAEYEGHWAFESPTNSLEEFSESIEIESGENEVDVFVKRRLKNEGLSFSPEAARETLIRRVALDTTGLPPSLEDLKTILNDRSESWYEKMVDHYLASPAYGEHRARYWLDAARYGDTHGLHLDNYREIWPYRDWVISAFNSNMPFDQFTIEQIAGDLLPDATQSQRVATGFNRCNVTTSEGGAIAEEFLARYAVDRVSTTSTVWLGLTAGCAQCHDHKFDPITQKEFYQLYAYFNNTTQPGMDGNAKDSAPSIRVYESEEVEENAEALRASIKAHEAELKKIEQKELPEFDRWLSEYDETASAVALAKLPGEIFTHTTPVDSENPANLGEVGEFSKDQPFSISFRYSLPTMSNYGRVKLLEKIDSTKSDRGWRVFVDQQSMNIELIESFPNKVLKTGATRQYKSAAQGMFTITYDGSGSSQGFRLYKDSRPLSSRFVNEWADTMETDFLSEAPLLVGGKSGEDGHAATISEVRMYDRALVPCEVEELWDRKSIASFLSKKKRNDKEVSKLRAFYLHTEADSYRSKLVELSDLRSKLSEIESRSPFTLVMQEKEESAKAHILDRGEYDQKREIVAPELPSFLPELAGQFEANRLGLANWLVHPDHPLTARVTVNRMWQELFGVGLVKSSEDFGVQGESPSHPELLDWLALSFVKEGWDVKSVYKKILMSRTYRQDSSITPELHDRDPENRIMARGPRFRLDAEVIRDQALSASGLMVKRIGGPSVKPYQPGGIWQAVGYTNSNTQTFFQDFGKASEHRRTLYSFWKRTAPPPNMALFDAPNREDCVVRRERTNTPLQALVLMNDPQFVRASRYLALRALNEKDNVEGRLDLISQLLRSRPMEDAEKQIVKNALAQFENAYASDVAAAKDLLEDEVNSTLSLATNDPVELASWTMVASQIMNLDEVLNKN